MTQSSIQSSTALVCFALETERKFFKPSPLWPTQVGVCITGMGRQNTAKAIREHLDAASPQLVLTCGFAGGLNPKLSRNTIVFSADEGLSITDALLKLGTVPARFHCSDRIAVTVAEKRRLWETTKADAVEMESEVIRQLCRERGIPSATIRVISDAADEDLPLDFNTLTTAKNELSYPKLAAALIRSPGKIPALLALQKQTTSAAQSLARCLRELLREPLIHANPR